MWRASSEEELPDWAKPAPDPPAVVQHARGGTVRVAVMSPPEFEDNGAGGATLRDMTLPKLFDAYPDGTWRASLVEPGSDRASRDGKSATFRLRDATWSDGSLVSEDDLARTADPRFVDTIEGPDSDGEITVRFRQKLPGWRNLWSGANSISAPSPGLTAGAFNVQRVTSGLETVLARNERAYGNVPFVDEVRLVVVSDASTARQLMATGQVDVFAQPPSTSRKSDLQAINGVDVNVSEKTGAWSALRFEKATPGAMGVLPRKQFVDAFFVDEAKAFDGFDSSVWRNTTDKSLSDTSLQLTMPVEEPLHVAFEQMFINAVEKAGGQASVQSRATADVRRALANDSYEVAFDSGQAGPQMCWLCTFPGVDDRLAERADSGDQPAADQLQAKARKAGTFLPLWRPDVVVGSRSAAVSGVVANGFTQSVAWGADIWWRP